MSEQETREMFSTWELETTAGVFVVVVNNTNHRVVDQRWVEHCVVELVQERDSTERLNREHWKFLKQCLDIVDPEMLAEIEKPEWSLDKPHYDTGRFRVLEALEAFVGGDDEAEELNESGEWDESVGTGNAGEVVPVLIGGAAHIGESVQADATTKLRSEVEEFKRGLTKPRIVDADTEIKKLRDALEEQAKHAEVLPSIILAPEYYDKLRKDRADLREDSLTWWRWANKHARAHGAAGLVTSEAHREFLDAVFAKMEPAGEDETDAVRDNLLSVLGDDGYEDCSLFDVAERVAWCYLNVENELVAATREVMEYRKLVISLLDSSAKLTACNLDDKPLRNLARPQFDAAKEANSKAARAERSERDAVARMEKAEAARVKTLSEVAQLTQRVTELECEAERLHAQLVEERNKAALANPPTPNERPDIVLKEPDYSAERVKISQALCPLLVEFGPLSMGDVGSMPLAEIAERVAEKYRHTVENLERCKEALVGAGVDLYD